MELAFYDSTACDDRGVRTMYAAAFCVFLFSHTLPLFCSAIALVVDSCVFGFWLFGFFGINWRCGDFGRRRKQ
jgi:hypothetical protein